MNNGTQAPTPLRGTFPTRLAELDALAELAQDTRWSWNHVPDSVWRRLDRGLWDATHNPWVVLRSVSTQQTEHILADSEFRQEIEHLLRAKRQAAAVQAWFQQEHPRPLLTCVAHFCMEFILSETSPIYSGGLGSVAGDHLKAASDLGVPVVGVGLLTDEVRTPGRSEAASQRRP
jgi:starch phosphorylase